ncbi:hypothetical protein GGI25_000212 [Coemansia spiralis]|uniref:Uncharacterized protein n=2 Tax=Coemansia TaxID=4863 RepID=A0A9W8GEL3_9FUNG|nr:hypothetical protein BX070DRAFT_236190 [Coemansia spiralis]KAJ1995913.1 hypothetical protein EDC05_000573 [Coemansia umbellata]KAJ2625785.1 hypothetical protein GGI26_000246 [Coemansia sp. RSA 1358]KAJ2680908.1 hypothetical protein GGI25_000212 [Coemansia spiralis]
MKFPHGNKNGLARGMSEKAVEAAIEVSLTPESADAPQTECAPSAVKMAALKKVRRNRILWLSIELVLFIILLALLIFHSFRLRNHMNSNTYVQWSSSWVMILLSVLLVIVALTIVITFYYYRTTLAWIADPATTDQNVLNPRGQSDVKRVGLRFFRESNRNTRRTATHPATNHTNSAHVPRNLHHEVQHDPALMQQPWLSGESRNSRAWRQMRAEQRSSSLSSPVTSPTSSGSQRRDPRHPPRTARKWQRRQLSHRPQQYHSSSRQQSSASD